MLLEDEIQQKSFKSPDQKLAVNLLYTTNWLSNHYDKFFKNSDLTTQQYNVLRILRGQLPNPCSLKSIKERMLDKMSDTSRILDKLVNKGYAIRTECPNDRRSVNVIISESGLNLLKELDFIDEATKDIFKNLSNAQIETLNTLLDKLRG
ncbi:MAG: MarR family transcriptional regulator [Bacteroidota bacterium]|nr:MarR family transcriptional regulator [Bacteroidota bacterium]MDP3144768.1 MarR family transcriptional regulator [Bacteroidota bacterium]MDP3557861.1 MarR family transcriptional regulator [Bacteroidota bacterium]